MLRVCAGARSVSVSFGFAAASDTSSSVLYAALAMDGFHRLAAERKWENRSASAKGTVFGTQGTAK